MPENWGFGLSFEFFSWVFSFLSFWPLEFFSGVHKKKPELWALVKLSLAEHKCMKISTKKIIFLWNIFDWNLHLAATYYGLFNYFSWEMVFIYGALLQSNTNISSLWCVNWNPTRTQLTTTQTKEKNKCNLAK